MKFQEKFTLPAGAYYIGDPCYILNDEIYHKILMPLVFESLRNRRNAYEFYSNPNNEYTQRGVVMHTLEGDGLYPSNTGLFFAVDSGQIACIDMACIGITEDIDYAVSKNSVCIYNFNKPFNCVRYDNGVLRFNSVSINTWDE